ncbi:MAG: hypothetical protein QJR05_03615 [Thermoanaerobacterium sp.]|nr:hypothetical protein [Thermoanaerobacterium sp.]
MELDSDFAEDRDAYTAEGIFWVPANPRRSYFAERAKLREIGQIVDSALDIIQKENDRLNPR